MMVQAFLAGMVFGTALLVLLELYANMLRRCRSGRKFIMGKLMVCGERAPDGAVIKEGWLYNAPLAGERAQFTIEGLPCTFKLWRDALYISCEKPIKVRP